VIVCGDSLVDHAEWSCGLLERQAAGTRHRLADGTVLVMDSVTTGGRYVLADSAVMDLEKVHGYPRGVNFSIGPPRPAFTFTIRSRRHVCAVVAPEVAGVGTRALLDSLGQTHTGRSADWSHAVRGDAATLIQYPREWYRSALLEIAHGCWNRLRVTWVAYDDAWSANPETLATEAGMLRQKPLIQLGRGTPPMATWDDVRRRGRIIGSVVADPVTRRLESCRSGSAAR